MKSAFKKWRECAVALLLYHSYCTEAKAFDTIVVSQFQISERAQTIGNPDNIMGVPESSLSSVLLLRERIQRQIPIKGFLILEGKIHNRFDFNPDNLSTKIEVNEFFWQSSGNNIMTSFGRKKVHWGVGYVASPSDIISRAPSPEDPQDLLYAIKGRDMLQLSWLIASDKQIDILLLPKLETDQPNPAISFRYYTHFLPYDVTLVGYTEGNGNTKWGGNFTRTIGDDLEIHSDILFQLVNPVLYPPSVTGSPFIEKKEAPTHLLVGGQWSKDTDINIALEYLFYSNGYDDSEWRAYQDTLTFLNQQRHSAFTKELATTRLMDIGRNPLALKRQHYLFTRLFNNNLLPFTQGEWIALVELSDFSFVHRISVTYALAETLKLSLRLYRAIGPAGSEFQESLERGKIQADIKWYF